MSLVMRCCLLFSVFTVVLGAPHWSAKTTLPMWYLPCGEELETSAPSVVNLEKEIEYSLDSITLQHRLAMESYLHSDYEYLYERVRIGVHEHQYIPNWVPGKADVNVIKKLERGKPQTIVNHFPKLHEDLQKFAVAFEELVEDETNPTIHEALWRTQVYLKTLLCEVESNIVALPIIEVPQRVRRSIMSEIERDPVDDTRRLIRDWGVLLKYKDYLHAWKHVFNHWKAMKKMASRNMRARMTRSAWSTIMHDSIDENAAN